MTQKTALNIGAVSLATGIPINTLRTWERRYGVPEPTRTEANHRLYDAEVVPRLRLVARALEAGHRPAQVLRADEASLRALVDAERAPRPAVAAPISFTVPHPLSADVAAWITYARDLDAKSMLSAMRSAHARLGMVRFLEEIATPFLVEVGDAWARGELQTFHEHFASERLRDFLVDAWRPMSDAASGPIVVCATLPGEQHVLGLHMAASILAMSDRRVVFVGPDMPLMDLRDCAIQSHARALFIGISASASPMTSRAYLAELRRLLPPRIALVVGGGGSPQEAPGVVTVRRLSEIPGIVEGLGQAA